jgi:hypothetical protein
MLKVTPEPYSMKTRKHHFLLLFTTLEACPRSWKSIILAPWGLKKQVWKNILQKHLPNSTSGVPGEKKLQNGSPKKYRNESIIHSRTTLGDPRTTLGGQSRPRYPQDLKKRGPRPENDVLEGLKSIQSKKNTFRKQTKNWP